MFDVLAKVAAKVVTKRKQDSFWSKPQQQRCNNTLDQWPQEQSFLHLYFSNRGGTKELQQKLLRLQFMLQLCNALLWPVPDFISKLLWFPVVACFWFGNSHGHKGRLSYGSSDKTLEDIKLSLQIAVKRIHQSNWKNIEFLFFDTLCLIPLKCSIMLLRRWGTKTCKARKEGLCYSTFNWFYVLIMVYPKAAFINYK